jgi:hypothetical protein
MRIPQNAAITPTLRTAPDPRLLPCLARLVACFLSRKDRQRHQPSSESNEAIRHNKPSRITWFEITTDYPAWHSKITPGGSRDASLLPGRTRSTPNRPPFSQSDPWIMHPAQLP